jgi:hypothetical protein
MLETIIMLVIVIPVILFPAAFVWYLNLGGLLAVIKDRARRRVRATKRLVVEYTK